MRLHEPEWDSHENGLDWMRPNGIGMTRNGNRMRRRAPQSALPSVRDRSTTTGSGWSILSQPCRLDPIGRLQNAYVQSSPQTLFGKSRVRRGSSHLSARSRVARTTIDGGQYDVAVSLHQGSAHSLFQLDFLTRWHVLRWSRE
jgi:hypothetical protein